MCRGTKPKTGFVAITSWFGTYNVIVAEILIIPCTRF
jgi:hypothetical protein